MIDRRLIAEIFLTVRRIGLLKLIGVILFVIYVSLLLARIMAPEILRHSRIWGDSQRSILDRRLKRRVEEEARRRRSKYLRWCSRELDLFDE